MARALACALAASAIAIVPPGFLAGVAPPSSGEAVPGTRALAPAAVAAELPPLEEKSYAEEFASGLSPVNTVRGVWRVRETRTDGSTLPQEPGKLSRTGICRGRLSFKGFVGSGKGSVEYKMCGDREGKGRWLTKPKNIINGK